MRFAEPMFRVVVVGSVAFVLGTSAALAAKGADEPVSIEDRVVIEGNPLNGAKDASAAKRTRGVAVAALSLSKGTDAGSRLWGEPGALLWAPTPAVPPLLSKPAAKAEPLEKKLPVLEDPLERALERSLLSRPPKRAGRLRPFDGKEAASPRGRLPVSRLPSQPMSTRWTDPLAGLGLDDAGGDARPEFIMPFANGQVTSLFNQGRRHPAIDLAGTLGSPVLATTSRQTVVFAGRRGGYGNAVITEDVYGRTHLYGHLQSVASEVGQVLDQGEKLGHLGSTGYSTGPHVHYEVRDGKGQHINPVTLLFPGRAVGKGYAWLDVQQEQRPTTATTRVQDQRVVKVVGTLARVGRNAQVVRRGPLRRTAGAPLYADE